MSSVIAKWLLTRANLDLKDAESDVRYWKELEKSWRPLSWQGETAKARRLRKKAEKRVRLVTEVIAELEGML